MKYIYILILTFLSFACNNKEILEEQTKNLAVETYYNTAAEIESAVNAIYSPLRSDVCLGGLYPAQMEAYADYGYGRGSYAVLSDFQGLNAVNITRTGQIWEFMYLSIRNANLVIANAPKGKSINPADVTKFVAEAKFMRAFVYFLMVRNWGGVILRTESNATEQSLKRSTAEEVYQLILADLQAAEQGLPATASISGRPTRWAAKTVLADVYLERGQWQLARDKAKEVIDSRAHSLVPVTIADDYLKIYGPEVITTPEEIFYLKYTRLAGQGFNFVMFAHHPGARLHGAGGFFAHYTDIVANPVTRTWDDRDLRKTYNLYRFNIGLGANSMLYKKFIDPLAPTSNGASNDQPWYKFSDVLFIYSEAAARVASAPTAEAVEALNQIRRRAYGRPSTVPNAEVDYKVGDYNLQTFIDLITKERGYENIYEGKRWLELKRLGANKLKEIILAATGKTVADKHLLWPIPVSELNFNAALNPTKDQNPGY
jgi:starch-binding outer membrane protein, SusD/RagB family